MRTIGLIGGMSAESSAEYYQLINAETKARLGGRHNARSVMLTVDFAEIHAMQLADDWDGAARLLAEAAVGLERAGADLIALCTNTMHKVAGTITQAATVPFVHIADATADRIQTAGLETVALLGTRFTMEMDFYIDRMRARGLTMLVPDAADRKTVDDIIFDELVHGEVKPQSRTEYLRVIDSLQARGARGVILGCTEIGLLVSAADTRLPTFDSTRIHAEKLVDLALGDVTPTA